MRTATLIEKAKAQGLKVTCDATGTRIKAKSLAVRIWPDGKVLRDDARLDLVARITVKSAADMLGIK